MLDHECTDRLTEQNRKSTTRHSCMWKCKMYMGNIESQIGGKRIYFTIK